jgi:hypothetical protein
LTKDLYLCKQETRNKKQETKKVKTKHVEH